MPSRINCKYRKCTAITFDIIHRNVSSWSVSDCILNVVVYFFSAASTENVFSVYLHLVCIKVSLCTSIKIINAKPREHD